MKNTLERGDQYDDKKRIYGVYIHKRNASLCIAYKVNEDREWAIDKGELRRHPIFRAYFHMIQSGTGNYFFNRTLKNYELIEETQEFNFPKGK